MQKTSNRSGRKGGYHGYTLSQAQRMLEGKIENRVVYKENITPQPITYKQRLYKKGKTISDLIKNKEQYTSQRLSQPLRKKGII